MSIEIKHAIKNGEMFLVKDILLTKDQYADYNDCIEQSDYFDMKQGVKKVLLNSAYGALLNLHMRFGDPRLGASTTYTGRQITSHMANIATSFLGNDAKIKKNIIRNVKKKRTGVQEVTIENEYKIDLNGGPGVLYGDTDSILFTMNGLVKTDEEAIELADQTAKTINDSFPDFMRIAFGTQPEFSTLIKANRELVCRSGLLQAKKKYYLSMLDKEGKRIELGSNEELKTMGSDIKLSSTPPLVKKMLKEVVMKILHDEPKSEIDSLILKFRSELTGSSGKLDIEDFDEINPLDLCSIISIKELDKYIAFDNLMKAGGAKTPMPANARASMNYNESLIRYSITEMSPIVSGDKIKMLWLAENEFGYTNMAFPSDVEFLPDWFNDNFEVDSKLMEQKLVDQKLQNIFDSLNWEVPTLQTQIRNTLLEF